MNCAKKLSMLKTLLHIDASDKSQDDILTVYLELAHDEILNWMYINYKDRPVDAEMPEKYDVTQVQAVVAGFNLQGGENELKHTENGITREFNHPDMQSFIRARVYQYGKLGGTS